MSTRTKISKDKFDNGMKIIKTSYKYGGYRFMTNDTRLHKLYRRACILSFTFSCSQLATQFFLNRDLKNNFSTLPSFLYAIIAIVRNIAYERKLPLLEKTLCDLRRLMPDTVDIDQYKIINRNIRLLEITLRATVWVNIVFVLNMFGLNWYNLYETYKATDEIVCIPLLRQWFPFEAYKMPQYILVYILHLWQSLSCVWMTISLDSTYYIVMMHTSLQLDLLSLQFKKILECSNDLSPEDNYRRCTKVIKRHEEIIGIVNNIESIFTVCHFVNISMSSVLICLVGFYIAVFEPPYALTYKIFLLNTLMQMWHVCWYGQKLIDSSISISDSIYACGWDSINCLRLRKLVMFTMQRSQKPLYVSAMNFSKISLNSYQTILKASWSYLMLLTNTVSQANK